MPFTHPDDAPEPNRVPAQPPSSEARDPEAVTAELALDGLALDGRPATRAPAPTRTSGRPMPGPRRMPSAEHTGPAEVPGTPEVEPPAPHPSIPTERHDPEPRSTGAVKVPPVLPPLIGLQLQPLVHVDDMAEAVAFYEKLGGEINHGDRAGEWVLMQVGTAQIGLVTRPPNASRGETMVELNFTATMPLHRLAKMLSEQGVIIVELTTDRDLGTQLHVETPEGMPIKIHQVEPELLV
jgi:predicted enzyme related to lactoylglutathione lyase